MGKKKKPEILPPQPVKEEEPDRLTQEATAALAAGMSYGKYKARQHTEANRKMPPPKQEQPDPRLKYDLTCQACGAPFKSISKMRKSCSEKCKRFMDNKRAREKKQKTMAESEQVEDLPPLGGFHDY